MIRTRVTHVVKRDKTLVPFDSNKILSAISKAAQETGEFGEREAESLAREVVKIIEAKFDDGNPLVEQIQDIVETVLIKENWVKTAKAYILYRAERARRRGEQLPISPKIFVKKRNGTTEAFSREKFARSVYDAVKGLENDVDVELVLQQAESEIFDGISTKEVAQALFFSARSFIEKDPAYSRLAARLLARKLYKDVIGSTYQHDKLEVQYRNAFVSGIQLGVQSGKLNPELLDFNLENLSSALKIERDDLFDFLGMQTLADRYVLRDPVTKKIWETPQGFWMRVAMGLALAEKPALRQEKALNFYEVMSTFHFVPSTPTLFHAGTTHPQLSSCYLTTIEDSLDHIFKCIGDNAQLSKWSGGLGNDWTYLRGTGALIKGTGVESQGIVPFLKVANDTTAAINRSGKRRGATCAYLETWHWDIEDFLELRKNTGDERRRTHDMDTANWIPDLFMQRVLQDEMWSLFSPHEVPDLHDVWGSRFKELYEHYEEEGKKGNLKLFRQVKAKDLWKKMLSMLYETGHPWITFKDPCNIRSPQDHVGVVHSSNLCTEITLNTSASETAVCNLGSVNLPMHIHDGALDLPELEKTVRTAMRMLDNVIDINFYPTIEAKNSNLKHRPVGLGIMGFQDALYMLNIDFASEACVTFADTSMEAISYYAILSSTELAQERGVYESYPGSKWDRGILPIDTLAMLENERGMKIPVEKSTTMDWNTVRAAIKTHGMRNSNCMAIAPTATISNIVGSVPSIEPMYKNLYVKSNQSGDFVVINEFLVKDLKAAHLWNENIIRQLKFYDGNVAKIEGIPESLKRKYKETFDIDPKWLIKAAAYRGKWIDQSQSLNIFYKGTSGKEIHNIYMYAWEMGIKTTYYLRTLAASQVEKSTVGDAGTQTRDLISEKISKVAEKVSSTLSSSTSNSPSETSSSKSVSQSSKPQMVMVNGVMMNACRVDDPTCEACQ